LNRNDKDVCATDLVADPIAYENYVTRLNKFRNDKARIEKENKKLLNIKDINDKNLKKDVPRILNELYSPKIGKRIYLKDFNRKEIMNIKSLDKVKH